MVGSARLKLALLALKKSVSLVLIAILEMTLPIDQLLDAQSRRMLVLRSLAVILRPSRLALELLLGL